MKPNFTLILDQDGIVLLHRSKNGWRVVGQADPASAQLADEMQYLRRSATALAGGQFASKLVIPNSQILYQDLELDGDSVDRAVQVREALDGLTPYAVDELAFDWYETEAGKVTVAAVAEQTLQEAEMFADQHRFNPLSFVAIPEPDDFSREPFFGTASNARRLLNPGGKVERDQDPIDMQAVLTALQSEAGLIAPSDDTPIILVESERSGVEARPEHLDEPHHEDKREQSEPTDEPQYEAPEEFASEIDGAIEQTNETTDEAVLTVPETDDTEPNEEPSEPQPDDGEPEGQLDESEPEPVVAFTSRRTENTSTEGPSAISSIAARFSPHAEAEILSSPEEDTGPASFRSTRPTVSDAVDAIKTHAPSIASTAPVTAPPPRPAKIAPKRGFGGMALVLLIAGVAAIGLASATSYFLLGDPDNELVGSGLFDNVPDALPDSPAINDQGVDSDTTTVIGSQRIDEIAESDPTIATEGQANLLAPDADANADLAGLYGIDAPEITLSGIRQLAPVSPETPSSDRIDELYIASIDRIIVTHDAVALPAIQFALPDAGLSRQAPPPEFGSRFALDDNGLVAPSPEGTLSPDGILIFSGRPAIVPIPRPGSNEVVVADGLSAERRAELAAFLPVPRPGTLAETEERSRLSGLSRNELAGIRPIPRPAAAVAQPEPEIVPGEPTDRAVAVSIVPLARPSGLAEAVREAAVQAVRPPPPPSGASVAQAATIRNGLRLNQVNLVGVYGSSSSRRALVRMPGGRFVMVTVGDRLDGGRVAAISANSLVYTKSGRNVTLEVPNG